MSNSKGKKRDKCLNENILKVLVSFGKSYVNEVWGTILFIKPVCAMSICYTKFPSSSKGTQVWSRPRLPGRILVIKVSYIT